MKITLYSNKEIETLGSLFVGQGKNMNPHSIIRQLVRKTGFNAKVTTQLLNNHPGLAYTFTVIKSSEKQMTLKAVHHFWGLEKELHISK